MNISDRTVNEVREMRVQAEDQERARKAAEEPVRRALCGVLDRLGADGVCTFLNGDSPEELADGISMHVAELEARSRADERSKTAVVLTKVLAMLKAGDEGGAVVVIEDEITRLTGGTT